MYDIVAQHAATAFTWQRNWVEMTDVPAYENRRSGCHRRYVAASPLGVASRGKAVLYRDSDERHRVQLNAVGSDEGISQVDHVTRHFAYRKLRLPIGD
jgi:hypothetical protein